MLARRGVRLGVLGGTFDPIHDGHLLMARRAARAGALDHVLFVPTGAPSHRDATSVSPISQRCAMVALALQDERRFHLCTADAERPGPTYTVDTLRDVQAEYGRTSELFFITGADNLANILDWRDSTEVLRIAHVIGTSRVGFPLADPGLPVGQLSLLPITPHTISSTRIRRLVSGGLSVLGLTPEAVARYIAENGLYSPDSASWTASNRGQRIQGPR